MALSSTQELRLLLNSGTSNLLHRAARFAASLIVPATWAMWSAERPRSAAAAASVSYELSETNMAAAVCCSVWFGIHSDCIAGLRYHDLAGSNFCFDASNWSGHATTPSEFSSFQQRLNSR